MRCDERIILLSWEYYVHHLEFQNSISADIDFTFPPHLKYFYNAIFWISLRNRSRGDDTRAAT